MAKKNQLTTSDHLTFEEYNRLLDKLHEDGEYFFELYAVLSFCTACRASDVLAFRWDDVLGKEGAVVTEKKTGKTRFIPFNPSIRKKVQYLYFNLGRPDRSELVFKSPVKDEAVTIQFVNRRLKDFKWKYKLKIDHFSTHTFRKTFGRYVYDNNDRSAESLLLLNKILNHSNIEVTKRYIGITKDQINKVFDSIQL